ncbi:hypothetical protein O181_046267 [Austropuccinia psidii MF-1]|uniref:Uncharacterized protein n=1 Tax=Austropuccinia psidii MF-1 TaxID=1389203 RepID=A0A9Q3DVH6_9BASI|nr:hypothetical protein [Austropuccinia psidii MF-1]
MDFTIITTLKQKDEGLSQKKEGVKQGRTPSIFYQEDTSQPTSTRRGEEQEKELEQTIFPKLKDPKTPKGYHVRCLQNGHNLDGICQPVTRNQSTSMAAKYHKPMEEPRYD